MRCRRYCCTARRAATSASLSTGVAGARAVSTTFVGDGVICVHTGPVDANANDHLHWLYYYNFVDDNSAASTG